MKHPGHWCCALALALCLPAHAAPQDGKPDVSATPAAQQARAARAAVAEKQKQLFEEKNIPVDAQASGSTPLIDLPAADADAPGAVEK